MPNSHERDLRKQVSILSVITTRDEAGRHYSELYGDDDIDELESAGLIAVSRPVHSTGTPYSAEYSSVTVTEAGAELVDAYPEYWAQ